MTGWLGWLYASDGGLDRSRRGLSRMMNPLEAAIASARHHLQLTALPVGPELDAEEELGADRGAAMGEGPKPGNAEGLARFRQAD